MPYTFRSKFRIKLHIHIITLFILLTSPIAVFSEDKCSDILLEGLQDRFVFDKSQSLSQNLESWFRSDGFRDYVRNFGDNFSLAIPIPKIGKIGFGSKSSSRSYRKLQELIDTGQIRNLNESQSSHILAQFISKERVDAWRVCMERRPVERGIVVARHENRTDGRIIIVYLDYRPIVNADNLPIINNFECFGGLILNTENFQKGDLIDYTGKAIIIKRAPENFVTLFVETSRGTVVKTIDLLNQKSSGESKSSLTSYRYIHEIPIEPEDYDTLKNYEILWAKKLADSTQMPAGLAHIRAMRVRNYWHRQSLLEKIRMYKKGSPEYTSAMEAYSRVSCLNSSPLTIDAPLNKIEELTVKFYDPSRRDSIYRGLKR